MSDLKVKRTIEDPVAPYAAALEVFRPRQGEESIDQLPVSLEVTLGDQEFIDPEATDGFGVVLSFRRVIIALYPEGCEVAQSGRYERTIASDVFLKAISEQRNTATDTAASATVEGGVGVEASWFAKFKLGAFSKAEAAHARKNAKAVSIDAVAQCAIVSIMPQHRWEIGRFIEDATGEREGPLGVLRGSFFDDPSTGGEGGTDLCIVTATGKKGLKVTVELRARIADCILMPQGQQMEGRALHHLNKALIEQRLGVKMIEERNRKRGLTPPPGEVILARGSVSVKPERAKA